MQDTMRASQVELVKSVWTACGYILGTLIVPFIALLLVSELGASPDTLLISFVGSVIVMGGLTIALWREVGKNKKTLAELKIKAAEQFISEQKGVWPPPPSRPKG